MFNRAQVHDRSSFYGRYTSTHAHYFSIRPLPLIVSAVSAHTDAVFWPLLVPFKAPAVELAALVLAGFHVRTCG